MLTWAPAAASENATLRTQHEQRLARQKRLARFAGAHEATSPSSSSTTPPIGAAAASVRTPVRTPVGSPSASDCPQSVSMLRQASADVSTAGSSVLLAASPGAPTMTDSFDVQWRLRLDLLAQVLELHFDCGATKAPSPQAVALPTLRAELNELACEQGDVSVLDVVTRALLGRFSSARPATASGSFEWLLASFRRAEEAVRTRIKQSREYELLSVVLEQVICYSVIVLEDASMFDPDMSPERNQELLFEHLLRDVCILIEWAHEARRMRNDKGKEKKEGEIKEGNNFGEWDNERECVGKEERKKSKGEKYGEEGGDRECDKKRQERKERREIEVDRKKERKIVY